MTKYEQGIKLLTGLDVYRPVPHEEVVNMLGSLIDESVDLVNNEHVELRSPDNPANCPAINLLPRGWYKFWRLPADTSVDDLHEHMINDYPTLAQETEIPVKLAISTSRKGRFLIAKPDEESDARLRVERANILLSTSKKFQKNAGEPKRFFLDITLAYINSEIDGRFMRAFSERVRETPEQIIQINPLKVEIG